MLLAHLKEITKKNLEVQIANCVIGIPSYFTALQRRAYLHAAEIARLNPVRLMHDCTAIALGYGIYKLEFPNRGPTNNVFVDIGHCDTQVAVVSFEPGLMKVLSHAFDSNLGGSDFDEVLFKTFVALFRERHNIDVYSSARASIRLRAACEKLKKVLSASLEAPLNIECLMENSKMIYSMFRKEPSRTLNASECVARGCALQCAMLSPEFRVREYEVEDYFPFSIAFA